MYGKKNSISLSKNITAYEFLNFQYQPRKCAGCTSSYCYFTRITISLAGQTSLLFSLQYKRKFQFSFPEKKNYQYQKPFAFLVRKFQWTLTENLFGHQALRTALVQYDGRFVILQKHFYGKSFLRALAI